MSEPIPRTACQLGLVYQPTPELIARARQVAHDKLLVDVLGFERLGPVWWVEVPAGKIDEVLGDLEPNDHEREAQLAAESGGRFGDIEFGTHLGLRAQALEHPDAVVVAALVDVLAPAEHPGPGS